MSYNHTNPTVTTMNPPDANHVPDTVKVFMRMTNERLCEAVRASEAILEDVRGPKVEKAEDARDINSMLAVAEYHAELADRLCMNLKEIADIIGVYA